MRRDQAVYIAMREQGITNEALASRLGMSVDAVEKLVDPRYRSHISHIERALRIVGRSLVVEDCDAVPPVVHKEPVVLQTN